MTKRMNQMLNETDPIIDLITQLQEENEKIRQEYHELAHNLIYEGHSISWWESQANNYGNVIKDIWKILYDEAGIVPDGDTDIREAIRDYIYPVKE